jgi:hypothetical protein
MPMRQVRSDKRGRPPRALGTGAGRSGYINSNRPSGTSVAVRMDTSDEKMCPSRRKLLLRRFCYRLLVEGMRKQTRTTTQRKAASGKLLSQAAYARLKQVTKGRVSQWKKERRLVMVKGLVDVAASDRRLADTETPAAQLRSKSNGHANGEVDGLHDYRAAHTERLKIQSELDRLKLAVRKGELVDREEADKE